MTLWTDRVRPEPPAALTGEVSLADDAVDARDAIAHLRDRVLAVGDVYQLCDPDPLTVAEMVDALAGTDVECPPFASSVDEMVAFVRDHPEITPDAMT